MLAIKYSRNIIKNMKQFLAVFLLIVSLCVPATAHAASTDVLITALQTETVASASEEYIIVTNNAPTAIDVSGWHLQYFSATAANFDTPNRNIALTGTLNPKNTFTATSSGYKTDVSDVSFGAGLAATGGHIRLVSGSGASLVQHDLIGWGSALHPETSAVSVAATGKIYSRKTTADENFIDTDNNANDFDNGSVVAPPAGTNTGGAFTTPPTPEPPHEALEITELLPNPASPATDATGEFVELYNPNESAVDLTGYKLQSGLSNSYTYTFKSGSLAAGQYEAFYAPVTKLTLSNTSGKARLLNPSGVTVSETEPYGKAPSGSSWMHYAGVWSWTSSPTPNTANSAAVLGASTTASPSGTTQATTAKTTAAKAKAAGDSKASAAKAKTPKAVATTAKGDYKNPTSNNKSLPVNPLLLAAIGIPLVGYMLYEYRHDLANLYTRLRRNRTNRREARSLSSGR